MLRLKLSTLAIGALLLALVGPRAQTSALASDAAYNPEIKPENFVSRIDNKYFTLKPGAKFSYRKGSERSEVVVTSETKMVMGVTTTVVRDRVWVGDVLKEDTYDWYAQDRDGNVWYFGEEVANYKNGVLTDRKGAWQAGVDGAKPGIIMLKEPKVGDTYRQEYYQGKAEDMGTIVAVGKKITVPAGTFDNCVQVKDWNPLARFEVEHKYYCQGVAFVVLEEDAFFGSSVFGGQKSELVKISSE